MQTLGSNNLYDVKRYWSPNQYVNIWDSRTGEYCRWCQVKDLSPEYEWGNFAEPVDEQGISVEPTLRWYAINYVYEPMYLADCPICDRPLTQKIKTIISLACQVVAYQVKQSWYEFIVCDAVEVFIPYAI